MELLILALVGVAGILALRTMKPTIAAPAPAAPSSPPPPSGVAASFPEIPQEVTYSPADLSNLIGQIALEEGYERPELARAIAAVESGWNPRAVNRDDSAPLGVFDEGDSVGLMQLKLRTARAYVPWVQKAADLFDPFTNIRTGVRFLRDLETKWLGVYGLDGVIEMYNLGETRYRAGERSADYLARVRRQLRAFGAS